MFISKNYGKPTCSKNFQTGMFYGNGSDIENSAKKTDVEKTDGNSLMAKLWHQKV